MSTGRSTQAESPTCPKCGGPMILRTARKDGHKFWGCAAFNRGCYGMRNYYSGASFYVGDGKIAETAAAVAKPELPKVEPKVELPIIAEPVIEAAAVQIASGFVPSIYQTQIFSWVTTKIELSKTIKIDKNTKPHALFVAAVAGSGKTTTGLQMLKLLDPKKQTLFVAFGKRIAQHLANKAPKHVNVCTYHSLGFKAVRDAFGKVEVEDDKVNNILCTLLNKDDWKHTFPAIEQLVSLIKANLCGTSEEEILSLADHYGIEMNGDQETILEVIPEVIRRCKSQWKIVDYDDMCWLPVVLNLPMKKYDNIFIDEAQDSNKVQVELALRSVRPGGIIMAVGDHNQSMFGFRGADVNAIPNLIAKMNCEQLPLSVTYRCPKSHVQLVNKHFPNIKFEAAEHAIEGTVRTIREDVASAEFKVGDMVICRTNAPLVGPAFELIRRGVKAVIVGREIGKGLSSLIDKMRCETIHDLIVKLTAYKAVEVEKLTAAEKNTQAQNLTDKVETIIALTDGIDSIHDLHDRIKNIFSDDAEGVTFSSVHRAKGLEAKRVYILHPELMPHPMAKKDWERDQEDNIKYVAETRSLEDLIFVVSDK